MAGSKKREEELLQEMEDLLQGTASDTVEEETVKEA